MFLEMHKADSQSGLAQGRWDLALIGPHVDERGAAAVAFATQATDRAITLVYDTQAMNLFLDTQVVECDELENILSGHAPGSVLLETTTLGSVEIALCCRSLLKAHTRRLSLLYVEPERYFVPRRREVVHRRDFELSDEIHGYSAIPGWAFILDETSAQRVVFLLGYEGQRLDLAFEQLPLPPRNCSVVFGVPAYRPGWEMDSLANNVHVIRERVIGGGVFFCGADNPAATLDLLEKLYRERAQDEKIFVAPIGTKPHALGAVLFACMRDDVGILYDHPTRRQGRSERQGAWHLFEVHSDATTRAT